MFTRIGLVLVSAIALSVAAYAGVDDLRIVEVEPHENRIEILHDSATSHTLAGDIFVCLFPDYPAIISSGTTLSANQRISIDLDTTTATIVTSGDDMWLYRNNTNFDDANNLISGVQFGITNGVRTPRAVTAGAWSSTSSAAPVPSSGQSLRWDGAGNSGDDWVIDGTPSIGSADSDSSGTSSSLAWSSSSQTFEGLTVGDNVTAISNWTIVNTSSTGGGDFSIVSSSTTPSTSGTRPSGTTKWLRINDTDAADVQNRFYGPTINTGTTPTVYCWDFYVLIEQAPSSSASNFPRLTIQHDDSGFANAWGIEIQDDEFHLVRTGVGGSETTTSMGSMSTNTWYKLTLAVDFTNNEIQGRINNGNATTLSTSFSSTADEKLFRFCYRGEGTGNTARLLLDDISLTNIYPTDPEITSTAGTNAQASFAYSYAITATGVPSPDISVSGLPSWLSFNSTTDTISGTPTNSDVGTTGNITVTADNGFSTDATEVFQITVISSAAPSISSSPGTTATEDFAYSYTVSASGTPAPTITVTGLPAWLTFDNVDTISGTPASGDVGNSSNITFTAANGVTPDATQSFTLDVEAAVAPTITGTATTLIYVGQNYSYQFTVGGNPAPTVSVTGLPGWLSYDSGTNTISGTPQSGDVGMTGQITIDAANSVNPDATQNFMIDVQNPLPPVINSSAPLTATEASMYSYIVMTTGNPTPDVTVTGLPAWLSFDAGTNTLSGTPGPNDGGMTGTITITASNGFNPDATESFQIDVTVFAAPQITSAAKTTAAVDTAYSYQITATGFPNPTISASGLPGWLSFDGTDTLSGTPSAGDAGTSGTITITATNGIGSDATQSFQITVDNPIAPTITSTAVTTGATLIAYSYTVTAAGNPAPTITVSGLPSWLSFDGTDTISGTPSAGDSGLTGTITVTAANGVGSDATQDFQIDVALEIPPAITSVPATTIDYDMTFTYVIVATGEPAPTITVSNLPDWLNFDGTDTISGMPSEDDILETPPMISVVASNGIGADHNQGFSVTVTGGEEPTITSVALDAATVGTEYSYAITVTGIPTVGVSVTGLPAWLSYDAATMTISGTPTEADLGQSQAISVTATNGFGNDDTQIYAITVSSAPKPKSGGGGGCAMRSVHQSPIVFYFLFALFCLLWLSTTANRSEVNR